MSNEDAWDRENVLMAHFMCLFYVKVWTTENIPFSEMIALLLGCAFTELLTYTITIKIANTFVSSSDGFM